MIPSKFNFFHHIDQKTIDQMFLDYSPVFIISTGRSGSKFIHSFLDQSDEIVSFHEAFPTLQYFSNFAFHNQDKNNLLEAMFMSARFELILDSYNRNKVFVESNQCLSFFFPIIARIFKKSKFIHLIRHPGDFVRSAIMKGWHLNDSIWESGRVRMNHTAEWNKLNHIEKLAWVWKTTNEFIHNYFRNLSCERCLTIRFEDMVSRPEILNNIYSFVGCSKAIKAETISEFLSRKINEHKIGLNEPPNMKKLAFYPKYQEWPASDKHIILEYVGSHCNHYNYNL
jgi:hypothetical protein